jgi:CRISPR-associated protein Csx10
MITEMLKIKMLTDWHIGSGTGRPGSIDRLVQRDTNQLPYIPAKSLTGIWRDGCELVAQGLDNGCPGGWQQWVIWLFGEQQPEEDANRILEQAPNRAQLSVRSAHFPQALRDAFRGKVLLQSMTTFVKPGVKIDPHTGTALDEHLRFEEMTRSGTVLEAQYNLHLEGLTIEQQAIAKALLVTGASMVERLGAKRRRGAGRCQLEVEGLGSLQGAIALLEKTQGHAPEIPPRTARSSPNGTLAIGAPASSDWWQIELEVETQSPVIIHKRTVGNHQETQDYIPGTYFLPILLKQLSAYLKVSLGNALMHGDVVITNATPVVAGHCGQAVPFCLFEPKAKADKAIPLHQRLGKTWSSATGQQLKSIRQGYVQRDGQTLHRAKVSPEIFAHNTIVDAKQRPDAEVGGIYTYEALPAGLKFRLAVRLRDELIPRDVLKTAVNPLERFLQSPLSVQVGRTKKDDYGNVTLQQISSGKITTMAQSSSDTLQVWLLSDLLLRDARLRPTTDPYMLAKRLSQVLGVTLTLLPTLPDPLPAIDRWVALTRTSRTESWQTRWGLPRPSLVGLSAGSVMQFQVEGNLDMEKIRALEISGLGDRTAEGYGQLCFNSPLFTQANLTLQAALPDQEERSAVGIAPDAPGFEYAQCIERETWREMIRRAAGAIAADPTRVKELQPLSLNTSGLTPSKLGTLRSLVDSLRDRPDANRVVSVLERMENKDNWKGDTLRFVKKLVQDEAEVWRCYERMNLDFSEYRLTQDSPRHSAETLRATLWAEAVRILLDACIRAHQRASEQTTANLEQAHG